jgi:hypothetical protein
MVGISREELLKAAISPVRTGRSSREFLEKNYYVIAGERYIMCNLGLVLLHLLQIPALSKVAVDGI